MGNDADVRGCKLKVGHEKLTITVGSEKSLLRVLFIPVSKFRNCPCYLPTMLRNRTASIEKNK